MFRPLERPLIHVLVFGLALLLSAAPVSAATIVAGFESGSLGSPAEGPDALSDAFSQTTFSNERANTGSRSARINWRTQDGGDEHWGEAGGLIHLPTPVRHGEELWARMYVYLREPWSFGNTFVKLIRFRVDSPSGGGYMSMIFTSRGQIQESNELHTTITQDSTGAFLPTNEWVALELYVKFHSQPSQAAYRLWMNGQLIFQSVGNRRTMKTTSDTVSSVLIHTIWNGGVPQNQVSYVDDIVVTTVTPAARDAQGNPMIGLVNVVRPNPPTNLTVR